MYFSLELKMALVIDQLCIAHAEKNPISYS